MLQTSAALRLFSVDKTCRNTSSVKETRQATELRASETYVKKTRDAVDVARRSGDALVDAARSLFLPNSASPQGGVSRSDRAELGGTGAFCPISIHKNSLNAVRGLNVTQSERKPQR